MLRSKLPYLVAFLVVLALEILIACFVRDTFIRPYAGDVLATVLLCCFARLIVPARFTLLPLWVFGFSVLIEICQYVNLARFLHVQGTWLGIVIGSTFDWVDILCYFIGCVVFCLTELVLAKRYKAVRFS